MRSLSTLWAVIANTRSVQYSLTSPLNFQSQRQQANALSLRDGQRALATQVKVQNAAAPIGLDWIV
jgi:hypothetical protein